MADLRRRAVNRAPRHKNGLQDHDTSAQENRDVVSTTSKDSNGSSNEKDKRKSGAKSSPGTIAKLKRYIFKPRGKRKHSFVFLMGGLFGIFVALFFANQNEVISLDALMDLNLDSLIDVMPTGILSDAREFTVC